MAEIPITLTCECGERHTADIGETVTCTCGRVYETAGLDRGRLANVRHAQAKMRVYMTLGIILMVAACAVTWALWGPRGIAVAIPVTGLLWFRFLGRYLRKRVFYGAGELPTWQLDSSAAKADADR
jgi:hypothetical protein